MPTKRCAAAKTLGVAFKTRGACDDDQDKAETTLAKCCPSIARDAQTDVSRTTRGVWYVISGQETKLRPGLASRAMRGPAGHYYHPDAIAALRVVYEIHLIGGERETATLGFALDDVLRDRDQGNRRLAVGHDRIDGLLVQPFRFRASSI